MYGDARTTKHKRKSPVAAADMDIFVHKIAVLFKRGFPKPDAIQGLCQGILYL